MRVQQQCSVTGEALLSPEERDVPTTLKKFAAPRRVARSSESSFDSTVGTPSTMADEDRLPPPRVVYTSWGEARQGQSSPLVVSTVQPNERTSLVRSNTKLSDDARSLSYGSPKYPTDCRSYEPPKQSGLKRYARFAGFWGAVSGFLLSFVMVSYSVTCVVGTQPRVTSELVFSVLGSLLGTVVLFMESFHVSGYVCGTHTQCRPGYHIMLYSIIWPLGVLPYLQQSHGFALCFFLHAIPAVFFYVARLRREAVGADGAEDLEAACPSG